MYENCKKPLSVYAYKSTDVVLKTSSSGGAFTAIVDAVYDIVQRGAGKEYINFTPIVYGVTFDKDFNVIHKAALTKQECEQLRGSKYVQSNLGNVFKEIKDYLISGRTVLFTGTPCQVYAITFYLQRYGIDTTNLFTVDLVCSGAPSHKLWKSYLDWLQDKYNSRLKHFSFRYKGAKWKEYAVMAEFENGIKKVNTQDVRLFTTLFSSHLSMSESCYRCKFASLYRPSDLTIGDFWGIEKVMPEFVAKYRFNPNDGVSQILVNTDKGAQLMEVIKQSQVKKDGSIFIEECVSNDYLKYQHNLNGPAERPVNRDGFWKDYKYYGFEYIIKKYARYNAKGIIKFRLKKFIKENEFVNFIGKN